jgi:hypothetical protein
MFLSNFLTKKIANYKDANSIGAKLRTRRIKPLLHMIEDVYKKKGRVFIADIGGTEEYWNIVPASFLQKNGVEITIINLPDFAAVKDHGLFKFISADACDLSCFDDNFFDIAHSNSVVEHVGDWIRMVKFADATKRIAQKYFVQTPNYWFPIEPHCMTLFFHWLPRPLRIWLVMNFRLGHWSKAGSVDQAVRLTESARLLNKKMLQELFKDGKISTERFLVFPKSFVITNE